MLFPPQVTGPPDSAGAWLRPHWGARGFGGPVCEPPAKGWPLPGRAGQRDRSRGGRGGGSCRSVPLSARKLVLYGGNVSPAPLGLAAIPSTAEGSVLASAELQAFLLTWKTTGRADGNPNVGKNAEHVGRRRPDRSRPWAGARAPLRVVRVRNARHGVCVGAFPVLAGAGHRKRTASHLWRLDRCPHEVTVPARRWLLAAGEPTRPPHPP